MDTIQPLQVCLPVCERYNIGGSHTFKIRGILCSKLHLLWNSNKQKRYTGIVWITARVEDKRIQVSFCLTPLGWEWGKFPGPLQRTECSPESGGRDFLRPLSIGTFLSECVCSWLCCTATYKVERIWSVRFRKRNCVWDTWVGRK